MPLIPDPWWPVAVMALIVLVDGFLTFRPPKVIADCLDGVGLPRAWRWALAVVKFLAVAGRPPRLLEPRHPDACFRRPEIS